MIETNQDNAEAIKAINLAKDLEQLQNDEKFKNVILEGFINRVLTVESMNTVHPNEEVKQEAIGKIQAATYLKLYMEYVMNTANTYTEGFDK